MRNGSLRGEWPRVAALLLAGVLSQARAQSAQPPLADDADAIERGAYLAQAADCAACHTADSGAPMAGGRDLATPFGIIHSTNITPDQATGIGSYSFEQFDRAVRGGIAADGRRLYPVMPYPSFARITTPDVQALFAYFRHAVAPVHRANQDNRLQWPFSLRFGLSAWNALFLDAREFQPDPGRSSAWNRGAYLVQGPGHCGACHTPRGLGFQERALDQNGSSGALYLSGGTVDAWHAPSLRALGPAQEIERFLATGRSSHAAAFGSMAEVVHFSTQHLSAEDLAGIADYLGSLGGGAPAVPTTAVAAAAPASDALYGTRGGLGYVQFCSTCHGLDGAGIGAIFPPLAGNGSILPQDPTSVIHVVLSGWRSPETGRYPRGFGMPRFSRLSDDELADILSFVRTAWGNASSSISAAQVHKIRAQLTLAPELATKFVTPRLADLLASANASELIYGLRLMNETHALLSTEVGAQLTCSNCHANGGTVANGSPYVGVSAQFPLYMARPGREIDFPERLNGCFRRSMNGSPLPRDSREMRAMVAYVDWMSANVHKGESIPGRGNGKVNEALVPDAVNGKRIYEEQCAVCHGSRGQGLRRSDGSIAIPALWGDASYNIGAGMARTYTAAAFVRSNMPIAASLEFPLGQGGLSEQQAVDVAEYFTHMPRPDFADKIKDWPKGGKPKDARY